MRFISYIFIFLLVVSPLESNAAIVTFLTSGTSYSIPSDWTQSNIVECIGAGGNGRVAGAITGRPGGGGGAYALVSNLTLSGSITYAIASGGVAGDTYFNGAASSTATLSCAGGKNATNAVPGAGGSTADSTGTVEYAGGSGGTSAVCSGGVDGEGGGGGGAAGPYGVGLSGDIGTGGAGGNGFGGIPDGGDGKEWSYGAGAGSGAGGHGFGSGDGGFYGGGGGGGGAENCFWGSTAGAGQQGIIVVTYWPTLSSMVKVWGGKVEIRGGRVRIY